MAMVATVDEAKLTRMVDSFYARVREDPQLGPIFEAQVDGRWPAHLAKMVDFWTSALLGSRRYAGNPRAAHARVPGIAAAHFDRWLELFAETLAELFDPHTAESIHRRARMMAQALIAGLDNARPGLAMTEAEEPGEAGGRARARD